MAGNGPFTIRQSFDIALPEARREGGAQERPTYAASKTSEGTYFPPKVALGLDVNIWLNLADEILTAPTARSLDNAYLATWEGSGRVLRTEMDVLDASSCHVFNPIDLALASFYRRINMVALNDHNATIRGVDNHARADRAWTHHDNWERPFAILEAKRAGTITPGQYEVAIQDGAHYLTSGEPLPRNETSFQGNSYELMAQAARYSLKYHTLYIALFDWEHLVLAVMKKSSGRSGGTHCQLTVVSDRTLMRRALLGFLHGAYQEVVAKKRRLPPPVNLRQIGIAEEPKKLQYTSKAGREIKPIDYYHNKYH